MHLKKGQRVTWTVRSRGASCDLSATYERPSRDRRLCIIDIGYEAARFGMPRYHRVPVRNLKAT